MADPIELRESWLTLRSFVLAKPEFAVGVEVTDALRSMPIDGVILPLGVGDIDCATDSLVTLCIGANSP